MLATNFIQQCWSRYLFTCQRTYLYYTCLYQPPQQPQSNDFCSHLVMVVLLYGLWLKIIYPKLGQLLNWKILRKIKGSLGINWEYRGSIIPDTHTHTLTHVCRTKQEASIVNSYHWVLGKELSKQVYLEENISWRQHPFCLPPRVFRQNKSLR